VLERATSVGITSAASTPEDLVQEIVRFFRERNGGIEIVEEGEWEEITFRQPKRVAPRPV
jgi:4-hydroxy-3-methylbut-2-enyl diphosphate reductase